METYALSHNHWPVSQILPQSWLTLLVAMESEQVVICHFLKQRDKPSNCASRGKSCLTADICSYGGSVI